MAPLAPTPESPPWASRRQTPSPLVQEMVDRVDTAFVLGHWSAISESPGWTTRHSRSQGCFDAADAVHGLFSGLGLDTGYQFHTSGYAPNVIGTIAGRTVPEEVAIAIAHLDDLPSSGLAPGADDNASGTAMVTALAEIMSGYCFERTVKLIAVTGEEQGLYGSEHYAATAAAANENIVAVLNADMIGWEGDGIPGVENLDLNYNSGSQWLAQAMVDAAADYATGMAVNAFPCSSMVYSDHAPFWDEGYPAVCGITDNEGFCGQSGSYPHYHQSSDTIANCGPGGPDFEAAAVRTYLATLAHIAQPIARIPEPPAGVAAAPDGPNRIALSWTPQSPGIDFRIYRAAGGCAAPGPPTLVGQTASAAFVDTTASGGVPYAYTVIASAAGSCSSAASECVDVATTGACTEPPTFAGAGEVVNAATSSCRLTVGWLPPTQVWCGGPAAYNVYRATDPGFTPAPGNRIATQLAVTSLDDDDVVHGETYHYVVRAVDLANGSEDGNVERAAGSPTGPVGSWTDDAGDTGAASLTAQHPWNAATAGGHVGPRVYLTGSYGNYICADIRTPAIPIGATSTLTFWSKYDIESGWDKGVVEISADNGSTWSTVPVNYPGTSSYTADQCDLATGAYFTGSDPGLTWTQYAASLADWSGLDVQLRWRLSTDSSVNGDGWWVDEIEVSTATACFGADLLFADGFESGSTAAWSD
ncbi:MAG TPA: M20/M25/M40 family metallo-hydrolase, partial [Candidatus Sulfomarinibacteraceae bacterium]|nr:M20/M25/M40 family metallo-hydrolase [Candidatus Sulfomarinibacteraceae bacterium]